MEIFMLAATTIDGYLADQPDQKSTTWTSPEDKQFYVSMIKTADAIIIGRQTFATFTRYPKNSTWVVYTREPEKFVNPRPEAITTIPTADSPKDIVEMLKQRGVSRIAISGGATVYTAFLAAGLIDKIYLTIEPITFGHGIPLFNQAVQKQLSLTKTTMLNPHTILLEYLVLK